MADTLDKAKAANAKQAGFEFPGEIDSVTDPAVSVDEALRLKMILAV